MSEKPGKTLRTLARLSVLALAILALSVGARAEIEVRPHAT